jgi:hypothetical protein
VVEYSPVPNSFGPFHLFGDVDQRQHGLLRLLEPGRHALHPALPCFLDPAPESLVRYAVVDGELLHRLPGLGELPQLRQLELQAVDARGRARPDPRDRLDLRFFFHVPFRNLHAERLFPKGLIVKAGYL